MTGPDTSPGQGYLLLADISGYTEFLTGTELEHAHAIIVADWLLDMERGTTCRCDACAAIPSLGLKLVTHFGSFMVETDDDREDLAGPDVILVHTPSSARHVSDVCHGSTRRQHGRVGPRGSG